MIDLQIYFLKDILHLVLILAEIGYKISGHFICTVIQIPKGLFIPIFCPLHKRAQFLISIFSLHFSTPI